MTSTEIENFRKVPRNDVLIYLHQNEHVGNENKMKDIYDRINKPLSYFYLIINDLIKTNLIITTNYSTSHSDSTIFPKHLEKCKIELTDEGKDYVISRLFNLNPTKFLPGNKLETVKIGTFSGNLIHLHKLDFNSIKRSASRARINPNMLYFLLTGKEYKKNEDKKIFISYSYDDKPHCEWVSKFAKDLDKHFIVEHDSSTLNYGITPEDYMKSNIISSDFVLIIFTPNYLNKTLSKKDSGAKYEFNLIQEELFRKISYGKYIPILKEGNKDVSIPKIMQAWYSDFRDSDSYQIKLKELIQLISMR